MTESEPVLASGQVWAVWARSLPTWNFQILVPRLQALRVEVTPSRICLRGRFVTIRQTTDVWFDAPSAPTDADALVDLRAGRSAWLGPYLDLTSVRPQLGAMRLARSPRLRLRLFMPGPEDVANAATQAVLDSGATLATEDAITARR